MKLNRIANESLSNPTVQRWFDVSACRGPAPYTYGNSARNILPRPPYNDWHFGLFKNFSLSRFCEGSQLQFRAEFFNFTGTPNINNPVPNTLSPAAGEVSTANVPREIQFALKLYF